MTDALPPPTAPQPPERWKASSRFRFPRQLPPLPPTALPPLAPAAQNPALAARSRTPLMSIGDWNREFGELVRRGANEPGDIAPAAGEQVVENDVPVPDADSDQAMAKRRLSIAAWLVQLGFITADRATPDNPAVEVLGELLPPDAELGLCLTCHAFSCQRPVSVCRVDGRLPQPRELPDEPSLG